MRFSVLSSGVCRLREPLALARGYSRHPNIGAPRLLLVLSRGLQYMGVSEQRGLNPKP